MNSHYRAIGGLLLTVAAAFIVALLADQAVLAFVVFVVGLALLSLLSVAYMRPSGRSPERHARVDSIVNDNRP